MTLTRFPNGVSSFGVPVLGGDIPTTTGTYIFVDSTTGGNANDGLDPDHPVADIDYAVGLCTANKGDVIICMPNHSETVSAAAGIDIDVAGVTVVGLGSGGLRPAITVNGSSVGDIDIGAADVTLSNIYFNLACTQTNPTLGAIDVNADNFTIKDCEFLVMDTVGGPVKVIVATDVNDLTIVNSKFKGHDATDATVPENILDFNHTSAAARGLDIAGCVFDCETSEAHIWSTASTMELFNIHHNIFRQACGDKPAVQFGTTANEVYGVFHNNLMQAKTSAGTGLAVGNCNHFENYFVTASGPVSGLLTPVVYACAG